MIYLKEELDKQFPKGDKARGKALVLVALANIEIEKAEIKGRDEFAKEILKYQFKLKAGQWAVPISIIKEELELW